MSLEEEIGENGEGLNRKAALEKARRYEGQGYKKTGKLMKGAKGAVKSALASTPTALTKYMHALTDWPYGLALFAAILKDIVDFVGIGSLPAIGTAVTFVCSIFVFFMMLLVPGARKNRKMAKAFIKGPFGKYVLLLLGTIFEMIFGLDFLPVETGVVLVGYWMLLLDRKESEEYEKNNPQEEE